MAQINPNRIRKILKGWDIEQLASRGKQISSRHLDMARKTGELLQSQT